MHLPPQITDLAIILGVAAIATFICQKIRQPLVLGYLIAGLIVGPYTPTGLTISDLPNVKIWAELGVIFLLFSLGLEFTFPKLISVGPSAGIAVVQIFLMLSIGYGVGGLFGWSSVDRLFLGALLSISSTTIIYKAFDELGVKTRRFAEIVFGILIVEDLAAVLLLVVLSTAAVTQSLFSLDLVFAALKLIFIVGSWFLFGYFLLPSFFKYAGKHLNAETLTIMACGLCLLMVATATHFGFSAALGAFIMGSLLGQTAEAARIEKLIEPLRDLFAAVFFVSVGMLVNPNVLVSHFWPIVAITITAILGNVFCGAFGSFLLGQPLKRSVQIGLSLAQIGEFSFIIATLGTTLGVTSDFLFPIAVTVSVVTTFTTPYLIRYSEPLAEWLESRLPVRIHRRLASYSAWAGSPRVASESRNLMLRQLTRFLLNTILVTLIFLAVAEWGLGPLRRFTLSSDWLAVLSWSVSLLLSAPFVWGMFFAFRPRGSQPGGRILPPVGTGIYSALAQFVTVVWLGAMSSAFFSTATSLIATGVFASVLFFFLYRRLERSYHWFERRFLQNVKAKGRHSERQVLESLAPWDVHTVRLTVHQNSALMGRRIQEHEIRAKYGLNIVAIQRGEKVIASPKADEVLFPHDELLVLGTDEQIERFRAFAEAATGDTGDGKSLSDYALKSVVIDAESPFVSQAIRSAGLREGLKGLIVGLERGAQRTINPEPDTVLKAGDILWIIGTS